MRLPVYEQQVRLAPKNRSDLNVRASGAAFGAQVGGAVQDLAKGIGDAAAAKVYKDTLLADADAKAGVNELIDFDRQLKYDPETGALVQTGANALGGSREKAEATLAEKRREIEAKLGPQAKKIFADAADRVEDSTADALIRHEGAQLRDYTNSNAQALAENYLTAAMDNYGDDAKWGENVNLALDEIAATGALNGMSPEKIAQMQRETLATAHSNRAIRIAYDDPSKADAYIDAHKDELGEAEYSKLKTGMEAAVVEDKAEKEVAKLRGDDAYIGARDTREDTWLRYNNGGKRNLPISPQLKGTLSFARDMGITIEVTSGGQKSAKDLAAEAAAAGLTGDAAQAYINAHRTGSERHDHGDAADIRLYKDGRLLSWKNPQDLPYFKEFVARAKAGGATGFGAGDGYMGEHTVHVGYGNPGVWGAEGSGGAAAPWLVEAYAGSALGATPATEGGAADAGMSTRSAYEAIMAIEDPKVRDAALAKLSTQLKTEAALGEEDRRAAAQRAWELFTQGGMKPENVPMDLQIAMGREGTLTFFESARAYEAGTLVTDETLQEELSRMAVLEPDKFAGLDLNDYRMDFSKGDFSALYQMQTETKALLAEREQGTLDLVRDPATMGKIVTNAKEVYDATVPAPKGGRTDEDMAAYNRFNKQVKEYASQFMAEKGRPMTWDEEDRLYSMLLTPVMIERSTAGPFGGRGNAREAMMFDAPFRNPGERIRGNVTAESVSLIDEEEARAELIQFYGREPSDDEILVHHNRKLLADMGVSPEMEYSEIAPDVRTKLAERYPDASDEELVDLYIDFVLETARAP